MTVLSNEEIRRVNAEITANADRGVVAYVFAVQFTPETVSFVRVPVEETRGIAPLFKACG